MDNSYVHSANGRCLFHKRLADGSQIIFCVHVDDFAVAATDYTLFERTNDRLHLSQSGLVKKLITIAGLNDDDKMVYIPLREDWSDEYQDASPLCTSADNYRILLAHIASGAHLSDQITQAMRTLTLASALPKPLLTPSVTKASSVALVRNRELSA